MIVQPFVTASNFCRLVVSAALLAVSCHPAFGQVDVLTQHNDNLRTGANLKETELTPRSVDKAHFGMLFKRAVDDQLYTQPLVVTGIQAAGGMRDLVYVTTVNNSVYAFDANDADAVSPVWHVNFGTPPNVHSTNFGCMDINGQMGIIGTPVVDKARGVLYVVALTHVGTEATRSDFMRWIWRPAPTCRRVPSPSQPKASTLSWRISGPPCC